MVVLKSFLFIIFIAIAFLSLLLLAVVVVLVVSLSGFWQVQGSSVFCSYRSFFILYLLFLYFLLKSPHFSARPIPQLMVSNQLSFSCSQPHKSSKKKCHTLDRKVTACKQKLSLFICSAIWTKKARESAEFGPGGTSVV